ncbi:MAG: hypothetical protein U0744_02360 [Gemmataceae bacterium]
MYRCILVVSAAFFALVGTLGRIPTVVQAAGEPRFLNGSEGITNASPCVAEDKELKAADVKLVVYAKGDSVGGAFTYVDKKTWVEDTSDGRHRFTETARDEWSVYLTVDNEAYTIQIDLLKKQIFIKEKEKDQRDLYKVLKAY